MSKRNRVSDDRLSSILPHSKIASQVEYILVNFGLLHYYQGKFLNSETSLMLNFDHNVHYDRRNFKLTNINANLYAGPVYFLLGSAKNLRTLSLLVV